MNMFPTIGDKLNGFTVTEVRKTGSTFQVFGVEGDLDEKVVQSLREHFVLPKKERDGKFFFRPGKLIGRVERV